MGRTLKKGGKRGRNFPPLIKKMSIIGDLDRIFNPEKYRKVAFIEDKTNENEEVEINASDINENEKTQDIFDWMEQERNKLWEREDTIRKETQAREDTAYQRAVEDMQRAGINPNLMNVTPASSGGGLTQATGLDYTPYETETNAYYEQLIQAIEHNFQGNQNEKDRIVELIGKLMTSATALGSASMFKK